MLDDLVQSPQVAAETKRRPASRPATSVWLPPHFRPGPWRAPRAVFRLGLLALMLVTTAQYLALSERPWLAALLTALCALLVWSIPTQPAVYALLWFGFTLSRGYADDLGLPEQGALVAHIDRWLGGGVAPSEWLQARLAVPGRTTPLDRVAIAIHASFFFGPHLAAAALWWWGRRLVPGVFRLYLASLAVTMAVGLLAHVLAPVAPPWMQATRAEGPEMAIARMVRGDEPVPAGDSDQLYTVIRDRNEVAALPSLHMGFTMLIGLVFWPISRRLGLLGLAYAASMGFSLIYLGEHYLVDVLAGTALALAAVVVAWRLIHMIVRPSPQMLSN